jgi:uncharacterized protein (UPF0371 family)
MGVNRAGFGITADAVVREAALQELVRRYFRYLCEYAMGFVDRNTVERAELLMREMKVGPENRPVVGQAREAAEEARGRGKGYKGIFCGAAIQLRDGSIVTGENSPLMHAGSSLVLNAIKRLAEIPDKIPLLSSSTIEAIGHLKKDILGAKAASMDVEEVLISLSLNASVNPMAQIALEKLKDLRDCEVHMTHIPTPGDEAGLKRLGLNLTSDPNFSSKDLFVS